MVGNCYGSLRGARARRCAQSRSVRQPSVGNYLELSSTTNLINTARLCAGWRCVKLKGRFPRLTGTRYLTALRGWRCVVNVRTKTLAASVVCAGFLGANAASAAVVLEDNFNQDMPELSWSGDSVFTSVAFNDTNAGAPAVASTDLIGAGSGFDFYPGNGRYVDMDGSTGFGNVPFAGVLQSNTSIVTGAYTLSFDLGGNARGAPAQTTEVWVGSFGTGFEIASVTLSSSAPFTLHSYAFNTPVSGPLTFYELGPSDQQGNILDNVTLISGVPEPDTSAMLLAGLGALGLVRRSAKRTRIANGS